MLRNSLESVSSEISEVRGKMFKKSCFKVLIDLKSIPSDSALIESYLNSSDFVLQTLGGERKNILKPFLLPNQSYYLGETLQNVPDGLGFCIDPNLSYYEGYFIQGQFSGKGRMFLITGELIQGEWQNHEIFSGTIFNFNNKTYKGELVNLNPHGKGEEYSDEYVYRGNFYKGKKNGIGKIEWTDGNWYEGEFVMGRIEGKGKFHWNDSEYTGDWKANKMHGDGVQIWNNSNKYEGSMWNGLKEGFGVLTTGDKVYKGFWKNGKEEGKGSLHEGEKIVNGVWKNGILLEVESEESLSKIDCENKEKKSGKIIDFFDIQIPEKITKKCSEIVALREKEKKFKFESASDIFITYDKWFKYKKGVYYGETNTNNVPHGKGIWLNTLQIYEGNWIDGNRSGFGRTINSFGEIYLGNFFKDTKFGFGVLIKKKNKYIGEWDENKFCGDGVLYTEELIYEGKWVNGLQHGKGKITYPDNKVFEGEFVNGVIFGNGTIIYENGRGYEAMWNNGEIVMKLRKIKDRDQPIPIEEDEDHDENFENSRRLLLSLIN